QPAAGFHPALQEKKMSTRSQTRRRRYRRQSGSFRGGIPGCLAAVRVDGRYKTLRLLVRRRVDVPQEILERKGLRPDDNRLVARIPKILQLVVPEVRVKMQAGAG